MICFSFTFFIQTPVYNIYAVICSQLGYWVFSIMALFEAAKLSIRYTVCTFAKYSYHGGCEVIII